MNVKQNKVNVGGGLTAMRRNTQRIVLSAVFAATFVTHGMIWFIRGNPRDIAVFLFPTLIALIMWGAASVSRKKVVRRHFAGILFAGALAAAVIVHERLIVISAAAVLAVLFARVALKHNLVPIRTFLVAATVFALIVLYLHYSYPGIVNHLETADVRVMSQHGLFERIVSRLLMFAINTLGFGFLALTFFAKHIFEYRKHIKQDKHSQSEITELKKRAKFLTVSAFAFFSVLFGLLYVFRAEQLHPLSADGALPLIMFSLVYGLYILRLELQTVLWSTVLHGITFTAFFLTNSQFPSDSSNIFFVLPSLIFSLKALLIVFVSCGRGFKKHLVIGTITTLSLCAAAIVISSYVL